MGHTLAEKIIMKHIGGKSVKPGDLVVVEPDCVVIHDIYTAFLQDKMKKMGLTKVWNTDKIVIMHDHLMPACLEGDPRSWKPVMTGKRVWYPPFPRYRRYRSPVSS